MIPSDERRIDAMSLAELCKPLSAKDQFRKKFTLGGNDDSSKAHGSAHTVKVLRRAFAQKKGVVA